MRGADVARVVAAVGRASVCAIRAAADLRRRAPDDDCRWQDYRPRGQPRVFEQGLRSPSSDDKRTFVVGWAMSAARNRANWPPRHSIRVLNSPITYSSQPRRVGAVLPQALDHLVTRARLGALYIQRRTRDL